jgi:hypothetical protein
MDCSFYELLNVSGLGHHEDLTGRSSIKLGLAWHITNSLYTAGGIPDCKSINLCHSV